MPRYRQWEEEKDYGPEPWELCSGCQNPFPITELSGRLLCGECEENLTEISAELESSTKGGDEKDEVSMV